MVGKAVAGTVVTLALAGCGDSSRTVTQTSTTQPQTQTATAAKRTPQPSRTKTATKAAAAPAATTSAAPSTTTDYSSTYPVAFRRSFDSSCTGIGASQSQCSCMLKYIEHRVRYSTVAGQARDIFTANPPSWFTDAAAHCPGQ